MRRGASAAFERSNPESLRVSKLELAAIERDRAALEHLRADLAARTAMLRQREENVIVRIESGAHVDGAARVLAHERQSISWFTVCRRELGEEFIQAEKASWPLIFFKALEIG